MMEKEKVYISRRIHRSSRYAFEVLAAARLPGVPVIRRIYEKDGYLYIEEEQCRGITLRRYLNENTPAFSDVSSIICDVCDILSKMHGLSPAVIHGALSELNIIISNDGKVFLKGIEAPSPPAGMPADPSADIRPIGRMLRDMINSGIGSDVMSDRKMRAQIERLLGAASSVTAGEKHSTVMDIKSALLKIEPMKTSEHIAAGAKDVASSYAPPGFRERDPRKMVAGGIAYFLMLAVAMNIDFGTSGAQILVERVFCFLGFLGASFMLMNYRNVRRRLPMARSSSRAVRNAGAIFSALLFFIAVMVFGGVFSLLFA